MNIKDILHSLEKDLGEKFPLNKQGKCSLTFNEKIDVFIKDDPKHNRFFAYCEICNLSEEVDPTFYEILLETHLLEQGTNGGIFGIAPSSNKIKLFKNFIEGEFDYDSFLDDFQILIQTSIVFQERLFEIYKEEIQNKNTPCPIQSIKA